MQLSEAQIAEYMPLAKRISERECFRAGCREWYEDGAAEINARVLVESVNHYDPVRCGNFRGWLEARMVWAVRDWLRTMHFSTSRVGTTLKYRAVQLESGMLPEVAADQQVNAILSAQVRCALDCLNARERYIVEQVVLLDRTQDAVAREDLHVNPSRVSQIYACAVEKMRKRLVN